jgi:hypothetical protein
LGQQASLVSVCRSCPAGRVAACACQCTQRVRSPSTRHELRGHRRLLQVHNFLALITIGLLGSEEQKNAYLADMASYKQVGQKGQC